MKGRLLLGLDIGTMSCKGLCIDEKGSICAEASYEFKLDKPHSGWAEQDPQMWLEGVNAVLKGIVANPEVKVSQIAGLALSGQMHGLVSVDKNKRVLRPAILWCDLRNTKQCQRLNNEFGERELIEITGNPAMEGFTLPKILWVQEKEPEVFSKIKHVLTPKDYICFKLTNELFMEISDAAGTLFLDLKNRKWAEEIINLTGLSKDVFPGIVGSSEFRGGLTKDIADQTGLSEGLPVYGGGADNTCAAVGNGIVSNGLVSVSIGTSGVVFAHSDEIKIDPKGRVHSFSHSVPNKYYMMGVMQAAGFSSQWFREILKEIGGSSLRYSKIEELAAQVPGGSAGVTFLPYLHGERTPHRDSRIRGAFAGLSGEHKLGHLARAVLEGVVFGLKQSIEIIQECGVEIHELRATGGGARSEFWCQMQADILGYPIVKLSVDEGPAYGAAILAGVGAGVFENIPDACDRLLRKEKYYEPNFSQSELYQKAYENYSSLYKPLKAWTYRTDLDL